MGSRLVGGRPLGISRALGETLGVPLWPMGSSRLVGTPPSPSLSYLDARREILIRVTVCLAQGSARQAFPRGSAPSLLSAEAVMVIVPAPFHLLPGDCSQAPCSKGHRECILVRIKGIGTLVGPRGPVNENLLHRSIRGATAVEAPPLFSPRR